MYTYKIIIIINPRRGCVIKLLHIHDIYMHKNENNNRVCAWYRKRVLPPAPAQRLQATTTMMMVMMMMRRMTMTTIPMTIMVEVIYDDHDGDGDDDDDDGKRGYE